jgi:hypothetical protein
MRLHWIICLVLTNVISYFLSGLLDTHHSAGQHLHTCEWYAMSRLSKAPQASRANLLTRDVLVHPLGVRFL